MSPPIILFPPSTTPSLSPSTGVVVLDQPLADPGRGWLRSREDTPMAESKQDDDLSYGQTATTTPGPRRPKPSSLLHHIAHPRLILYKWAKQATSNMLRLGEHSRCNSAHTFCELASIHACCNMAPSALPHALTAPFTPSGFYRARTPLSPFCTLLSIPFPPRRTRARGVTTARHPTRIVIPPPTLLIYARVRRHGTPVSF
ncbi:hypothetical protein C8J57DRAFT_1644675 [Mycena rebaudengoi]|nr:hypothetical protein C8J57DRAFT_1644675 [Mycena rebaudengoi]